MTSSSRPISEILAAKSPTFSIEFFPPKDDTGSAQLLKTAEALKEGLSPDFVSITYGAGGSTREHTLRYAELLKDEYGFEVMGLQHREYPVHGVQFHPESFLTESGYDLLRNFLAV